MTTYTYKYFCLAANRKNYFLSKIEKDQFRQSIFVYMFLTKLGLKKYTLCTKKNHFAASLFLALKCSQGKTQFKTALCFVRNAQKKTKEKMSVGKKFRGTSRGLYGMY